MAEGAPSIDPSPLNTDQGLSTSIVIPNKIKIAVKNSYKFEKLFHIK
tara:strand:+ start:365 stop:505 length:141 start_codon:yes stop_codon:yes gene_type:complete